MKLRRMPHLHRGRFFNYPGEKKEPFFWRSVYMYLAGWAERRASQKELADWHAAADPEIVVSGLRPALAKKDGKITWVGHATFLLTLPGISILTDPLFDHPTVFFQRFQKPGLGLCELPNVDVVVISHNHRDHMEKGTLCYLAKQFPRCVFYVPLGDKQRLESWGIERVIEANWWDGFSLPSLEPEAVKLTFLPAQHWTQRGLFDYNKSLWGSWMIEHAHSSVYFAGDTAYGTHFKEIAREIVSPDISLLPIGPDEPSQWLSANHMNAEEAGRAAEDLGTRVVVPMHWGTLGFGKERMLSPLKRIQTWWVREKMDKRNKKLHPLSVGGALIIRNS